MVYESACKRNGSSGSEHVSTGLDSSLELCPASAFVFRAQQRDSRSRSVERERGREVIDFLPVRCSRSSISPSGSATDVSLTNAFRRDAARASWDARAIHLTIQFSGSLQARLKVFSPLSSARKPLTHCARTFPFLRDPLRARRSLG